MDLGIDPASLIGNLELHAVADTGEFKRYRTAGPGCGLTCISREVQHYLARLATSLLDWRDVVIVDHHQIETRSEARAIWSDSFCAAGLGLLLSWALLEAAGIPNDDVMSFLGGLSRLAAIASIADCVPLTGPTRTLTRIGLAELGLTRHAGLRKMLLLAGVRGTEVPTSEQIGFRVAPRINAAGRVGQAWLPPRSSYGRLPHLAGNCP